MQPVPDIGACFQLMEEHGMLLNIRRHSIVVAEISLVLTQALSGAGKSAPDQRLVTAGGLLHDIAKTYCLDNKRNHTKVGAEICFELGFPEIARIVEEHVFLKTTDQTRYQQGIFQAHEIVYYADKRVRHHEIVDLITRRDYIIERYSEGREKRIQAIKTNFAKCREFEKQLFSHLNFPPAALADKVLLSSD